jgi:hypothetical protein
MNDIKWQIKQSVMAAGCKPVTGHYHDAENTLSMSLKRAPVLLINVMVLS